MKCLPFIFGFSCFAAIQMPADIPPPDTVVTIASKSEQFWTLTISHIIVPCKMGGYFFVKYSKKIFSHFHKMKFFFPVTHYVPFQRIVGRKQTTKKVISTLNCFCKVASSRLRLMASLLFSVFCYDLLLQTIQHSNPDFKLNHRWLFITWPAIMSSLSYGWMMTFPVESDIFWQVSFL